MTVSDLLQYDDPVVFGSDSTERIVGAHLVEDEDRTPRMAVYRRLEDDTVETTLEPVWPMIHVASMDALKGVRRSDYKAAKLAGSGHFKYLVTAPNFGALYGIRKAARAWADNGDWDGPIETTVHDKIQQYLVQSGRTFFKGMDFDGPKRMQLDGEMYGPTGFPNAERATNIIFIVSISTNRGFEKVLYVGDPDLYTAEEREGRYSYVEACPSEKSLLLRLNQIVAEEDPDVFELHNGFGFDLPYIKKRMARHDVDMAWGRDGSGPESWDKPARFKAAERDIEYERCTFAGRSIVDTMFAAMSFDVIKRVLPGYGLKPVAQHFGVEGGGPGIADGRERVYVPGDQIAHVWDTDPRRIIDYALDDVRETRAISRQLGQATFFLSHIVPLSYQEVGTSGTGRKIESVLVREYVRQRYSLPAADTRRRKMMVRPEAQSLIDDEGPSDDESGKSLQEVGGYTDVYYTGRVENVIYADVASLYPRIMIDFEVEPEGDDLRVFQGSLKRATDLRLQVKAMLKTVEYGSPEYVLLDAFQSALKTYINSMYGGLGFRFALFNDYVEADRVTTIGQKIVKRMARIIHDDGGKVIEVDTDGVLAVPPPFVYSKAVYDKLMAEYEGPTMLDPQVTFTCGDATFYFDGEDVWTGAGDPCIDDEAYVQNLTEAMPKDVEIDFDGRADVMMSLKRKNYALLEADGDGGSKLKLKGGSLRNRTIQRYRRDFMKRVVEGILNRDTRDIHQAYLDAWTKVVGHTWETADFCKSGTIKDPIPVYLEKVKKGSGNGGRNRDAAYELAIARAEETGIEVRTGDRVTYYVGPPQHGRKATRVFEDAKFQTEWDPEKPDEHTAFYLNALAESADRFRVFFHPDDFRVLFSTQTDLFFDYDAVEIVERQVERRDLKVVIAGSRGIDSQWWVERAMAGAKFLREMTDGPKQLGSVPYGYVVSEVVCGMAPGADLQGKTWAEANGIAVKEMPADWRDTSRPGAVVKRRRDGTEYDAKAGHLRNAQMADYADALVLIWDGKSPGSLNMLKEMRKRGKPVHVSLVEPRRLARYRGIEVPA